VTKRDHGKAREQKVRRARPKPSDIEKFKAVLLEKRRAILQTVTTMRTETLRAERPAQPKLSNHPAEIGPDNYELEKTAQLLETEGQILEDIDRAMELIERRAYGRCDACGKNIPLKRLEAIPWARLCVACANAAEKTSLAPPRSAGRLRTYPW